MELGLPCSSAFRAISATAEVTFNGEIGPLLHEKCASCHCREVGPFPLLSYEDAAAKAKTIVRVLDDRSMPPWHATASTVPYSSRSPPHRCGDPILWSVGRVGNAEG